MTNFASRDTSNLCISGDLGLVETEGHSSRFIQVLDESMCVVREDLTDWLQRYLFSTVAAPPIDSAFLLLRLRSGLWLSRLAYKLQLSVLQTSSGAAPPNKPASKDRDYNFLRGAVSNQNLRKVCKASLPLFPHTLVVCAGLPLRQPDVCSYSLSDTYPSDVTTSSSSAYSSSDSPEHCPQSRPESSKHVTRVADQWAARDNVSCFIQWCKDLGIPQTVLFETTGLVHRTEEKNVLLTLMELARIASRFGLTDLPELVRLEREIDALEEALSGRLEGEPLSLDSIPNPCTRTEFIKEDQFVDEGIAEDHDEKANLFILESDNGLGSSDVDRTPKPPEPQPLTRMRSVEVDPAVHNGSSKSTFTSFIAEEEEKREENPSNPVVLARPTQFMSSMVSDKLSDKWAMKDGSAQTVGPAGDVWTGAHDNERHDTISSDISRTSGVTSGRLSDAFVENQISGHRPCKSRLCTPPHHQSQIDFVVPGKRRASQPLPESYNGTPNKVAKAATFACATDSLAEEDEIPYNGTVSCLTPVKLATPPTPVTVMRQLRLACNEKKTNESPQRTNESSRNPVCLLSPTHSCHMNSTASHLRTTAKNVFGEAHFLSEQVEKKLALCTCCNRLHIQRLEEGRYKVNGRIYYFRRFRNHVMVRIGGGWLTLDVFLSRHDPCRRGKCVPAAVPDSRIALSSSVSDLQKTDFDSKKSLISMTTSVMALSRESSARSTSSDQSQSEVNEVVNTESSQPLNSSHPNLFIGAPSTNPKSLSLSTSRLPVPVRSSHGQSDISEGTGPTDNYYKIIPRAPSHSSIYRGSINSAARHSRESSQRRLSESSSSRVLSTTTVNSPSLRILSHVAHSSQGSATKPNLPQAPTRIPVPRKSVSRVSGSTQNSGSSIPSLTHSLLPTKTYHDEHQ